MDQVVLICMGAVCLIAPVVLIVLLGVIYGSGTGAFSLPGIARREKVEGKDWSDLPTFSKKASEGYAAVVSLLGVMFGLIGFLLPWVQVRLDAAAELLSLTDSGISGTWTGIALGFQSMILGIRLLSVEFQGAPALGVGLIVSSLFVILLLIALILSALIGVGLVAVPLGLIKGNATRLGRLLLILSVISMCLTCTFFGGLQATVGGVSVGGSEDLFGSSFSIGVEVARGFWISVGGITLALLGAIVSNRGSTLIENWATSLSKLDIEKDKKGAANSPSNDDGEKSDT